MNRLKYAFKFALIGFLIVLQASALIYMLVSEINKNIDFLLRERDGVQYIQSLTQLLSEAQAYRSTHYHFLNGNPQLKPAVLQQQEKIDAAFKAIEAIDDATSHQMDTTWKLQMLQKSWSSRKRDAFQFEADHVQVELDLDSRWLSEIIDLMQHVGYESNLAMDSDFDTSYLTDSALRKLPGVLDALSTAQALSVHLPGDALSADNKYRLLQVIGLIHSNLEQADRNAQLVFRHNDRIQAVLKPLHTILTDAAPIFTWNFGQKTIGQQGLPIPQQLLTDTGNHAILAAVELLKEDLSVIDHSLAARIDKNLQYRNGIIGFTIAILLLVCYLFLGFDRSVRKAVYQLDQVMASVGNGDLNMRGAIYSRDEMGSLTQSINNTLDSLQNTMEEVQSSHDKLEAWNQQLESKIAERTASLRNLLDHAGQGFLSFSSDLRVRGGYSAECKVIFQRAIGEEDVTSLIYPADRDQQIFLAAVFKKILQENQSGLREAYFSLLPEAIVFPGRHIGVAYKYIEKTSDSGHREIMLILTDRTAQKALEEKMQTDKNILAMIVHIVTHSADFFAAVSQYTSFCQEGVQNMLNEAKTPGELLATLFRTVHTFKGTFGQLRMFNTMAKLHEMEETLDNIRANKINGEAPFAPTKTLGIYTPDVMLGWLNIDLEILKSKLGEVFFQRGNLLEVENNRLLEIEEKVLRTLSPAMCSLLLPDLRRLRYKPIRELLQSYPEYVVALAEQNGKAIYPFEIEGGETMVDPQHYYDFIKALGHVFRNSIVHGLETYEERLELGKDERGRISCSVLENNTGLVLALSDDGRGIDPVHIRDVALRKSICAPEKVNNMSEEELIQLIFTDGFSGAQNVDTLAGRGVGLSAVRAELEKINGSMQATTTLGKGTQFQFFLPIDPACDSEPYSIRQLAKPLLSATEHLLLNDAGLHITNLSYIESAADGKLALRKVTSFLAIRGLAKGRMVLSADQDVAALLVENRFAAAPVGAPIDMMMETTLSHYADKIFQHALKAAPSWTNAVTSEAMGSILADDASAKYPQTETPTWVLDTLAGKITLSLIY